MTLLLCSANVLAVTNRMRARSRHRPVPTMTTSQSLVNKQHLENKVRRLEKKNGILEKKHRELEERIEKTEEKEGEENENEPEAKTEGEDQVEEMEKLNHTKLHFKAKFIAIAANQYHQSKTKHWKGNWERNFIFYIIFHHRY